MNKNALKRLHDALQSARYVLQFAEGRDLGNYRADPMLRSAIERQLEILGEALGRLRAELPEIEADLPELPRIVGLRNRLAHGYSEIEDELIWSIITDHLPGLLGRLESLWRQHWTTS
jgi:uncharacterized protein with HEPN domain